MKTHSAIDIIVPVWNRPVETRNCLVNLINYSSDFRLIMVDNGSDRETEKLLQEFSEGLDDGALLLRNDVNQGLVKALNRGMAKVEAEYFAVMRNTSLVGPGWLEPLLELGRRKPEAGLIIPRLVESGKPVKKREDAHICEVVHGSFAAMLIKREVYAAIGGLDEEMDGGAWCLKDYSRRACRAGYLTFQVPQVTVQYMEEAQLGSEARRQETLQKTIAEFRRRWGQEAAYCLVFPKGAEQGSVAAKLQLLLQGARRGWTFDVIVHHHLYKELAKGGLTCLHENIRVHSLPLLHTSATVKKMIARFVEAMPETTVVAGIDGMAVPGVMNAFNFGQLDQKIKEER